MHGLFIYDSEKDPHGTHLLSCRQLASICQNLNIKTEVYDCSKATELQKIQRIMALNNVRFIHAEQSHFISMANEKGMASELSGIPIVIQCRDPWFQPWIYKNLRLLDHNSIVIHMERRSVLNTNDLRSKSYFGYHTPHSPFHLYNLEPNLASLRKLVTFVGSAYNVDNIVKETVYLHPELKDLIQYFGNLDENQLHIPTEFWNVQWSNGSCTLYGKKLNLSEYSILFNVVRFKIRSNFLNICNLFRTALFISGDWLPEKNGKSKIFSYKGNLGQTHEIISSSKYTLSDQSGFECALGERVSSCLFYGLPLICHKIMTF